MRSIKCRFLPHIYSLIPFFYWLCCFPGTANTRKDKYALEQLSYSSPTAPETYPTNPIHGFRDWLSCVLSDNYPIIPCFGASVVFKSFDVVFSLLILRTPMEFNSYETNLKKFIMVQTQFLLQQQVECFCHISTYT